MTTLISIFKYPMAILSVSLFTWLSIKFMPSKMILFWLVASVFLDLITGLIKAWSRKICTVSQGFRKTVTKIGTYSATVVVVVILVNMVGVVDVENKYDLTILINLLMSFMVFIELFSICENIALAYPNTPLTTYMIHPILKFLKGKLKNNPISALGQKETKEDA